MINGIEDVSGAITGIYFGASADEVLICGVSEVLRRKGIREQVRLYRMYLDEHSNMLKATPVSTHL
jgi:hypothetical protein